jgi:hypothetical protein
MPFIINLFQFALIFFLALPAFGQAVCTTAKLEANTVSITHGYYLYPECVKAPEPPKPQPKQAKEVIDLKASIKSFLKEEWRKEVGSTTWWKDRIEENPKRFKEVEKAFFAVWGKAPLEQQKLALALCLVETGCGFGEMRNWRLRGGNWTRHKRFFQTHKFLSRAGACGVTQVLPQLFGLKCRHANASYLAAFKLQKRWLENHWNDGLKPAKKVSLKDHKSWLLSVKRRGEVTYLPYRYNGDGKAARRYGRKWKVAYEGIVVK